MAEVQETSDQTAFSALYSQAAKRIIKPSQCVDGTLEISDELLALRKQSWSSLFKKFSQASDSGVLNISSLRQENVSNDCYVSRNRVPFRKSMKQIEYWVKTGGHLHWAEEMADTDTDETVSLSESEGTPFEETLNSSSIFGRNKRESFANGAHQDGDASGSDSSVDTTAYILQSANAKQQVNTSSTNEYIHKSQILNQNNNRVSSSDLLKKPKDRFSSSTQLSKNTAPHNDKSIVQLGVPIDSSCEKHPITDNGYVVAKDYTDKRGHEDEIGKNVSPTADKTTQVDMIRSADTNSLLEPIVAKVKSGAEKMSESSVSDTISHTLNKSSGHRKLFTNNESLCDVLSMVVDAVSARTLQHTETHAAVGNLSKVTKRVAQYKPRSFCPLRIKNQKRYTRKRSCTRNRHKSVSKLNSNEANESKHVLNRKSLGRLVLTDNSDKCDTANTEDAKYMNDVHPNVNQEVSCEQISPKLSVPYLHEETEKVSFNKSPTAAHTSITVHDDSKIISKQMQYLAKTSIDTESGEQQLMDTIAKVLTPEAKPSKKRVKLSSTDDEGSVCKQLSGSTSTTNKIQNFKHVKKNLYTTGLRSSTDTDASDQLPGTYTTKAAEDCESNLLPQHPEKSYGISSCMKKSQDMDTAEPATSSHFTPVVILHDFLSVKNCCGELEKENHAKWLQNQNCSACPSKDLSLKVPVILLNRVDDEIPCLKSKSNYKISHNIDVGSSDNKALEIINVNDDQYDKSNLSCTKAKDDRSTSVIDCTQGSQSKENVTPTSNTTNTGNTTRNKWDLFLVTSSDEEDTFEKLISSLNSRSWGRNSSNKTNVPVNSVHQDTTEQHFLPVFKKSTLTFVTTSSEDELESPQAPPRRNKRSTQKQQKCSARSNQRYGLRSVVASKISENYSTETTKTDMDYPPKHAKHSLKSSSTFLQKSPNSDKEINSAKERMVSKSKEKFDKLRIEGGKDSISNKKKLNLKCDELQRISNAKSSDSDDTVVSASGNTTNVCRDNCTQNEENDDLGCTSGLNTDTSNLNNDKVISKKGKSLRDRHFRRNPNVQIIFQTGQ